MYMCDIWPSIAPVRTIEPDRVRLSGSEIINVIVQNVYNVAGRDRISSLNNNTWPCNYTEDFVWDWPYHPKFVTIGARDQDW